jgi:hypothetical protein
MTQILADKRRLFLLTKSKSAITRSIRVIRVPSNPPGGHRGAARL